MKLFKMLIFSALVLSIVGIASATSPSIMVKDQNITGNMTMGNITIEKVVSDGPGIVVIENSLFGKPGGSVGYTAVPNGTSTNVSVTIDTKTATGSLVAALHKDLGQPGCLKWPPVDVPQTIGGQPVMKSFNITGSSVNVSLINLTELAKNRM